jgi:hypothetical protein
VLAAIGVLWVLITPAPDELPCTTGYKSFGVALTASTISVVLQPLYFQSSILRCRSSVQWRGKRTFFNLRLPLLNSQFH